MLTFSIGGTAQEFVLSVALVGRSDQLTVTVLDDDGNPLAGLQVFLAVPSGNGLLPEFAFTGPDGSFTVDLVAFNQAGAITPTATFGTDEASTTVTILAGPPSAATSSLVASETTVIADGTSQTTLTVTVEDALDNPLAGSAVTLSASGSGNIFGAISGTTDAHGVFSTTLASTLAQTETVTATEGDVQESDTHSRTSSGAQKSYQRSCGSRFFGARGNAGSEYGGGL